MKTRALALASVLLLMASPLAFAHCFSIWNFHWRQPGCSVHAPPAPPRKDGEWFVEITTPPPVDERTPDEIAEQQQHDEAVAEHHDQINRLMRILRDEQTWGVREGVN